MATPLFRGLALSLSLACLAFSNPTAKQNEAASASLNVHEWGTFTSIAGHDGEALRWSPRSHSERLPQFVEHFRMALGKDALEGTVRMETPVLYFYAPTETMVSVHVSFARGIITEWYPHASRVEPNPKGGFQRTVLYDSRCDGSITWDHVTLEPGWATKFPVTDNLQGNNPQSNNARSRYYAARETASAPLLVKAPGGVQQEKFLFYRGVAAFPVPISATVAKDGRVRINNLGQERIPQVILFERRGDKLGYRMVGALDEQMSLEPPELTSTVEVLNRDLQDVLTAQGLYPDEAHAMVETWQDSWSEEGSRLFYIVPSGFVNTILPLRVDPAPAQVTRIFVGRLELITPATERAVETALATHDVLTINKYERFLEPILDELKAENPGKAGVFDKELSEL